jgi:hypothetical protein
MCLTSDVGVEVRAPVTSTSVEDFHAVRLRQPSSGDANLPSWEVEGQQVEVVADG